MRGIAGARAVPGHCPPGRRQVVSRVGWSRASRGSACARRARSPERAMERARRRRAMRLPAGGRPYLGIDLLRRHSKNQAAAERGPLGARLLAELDTAPLHAALRKLTERRALPTPSSLHLFLVGRTGSRRPPTRRGPARVHRIPFVAHLRDAAARRHVRPCHSPRTAFTTTWSCDSGSPVTGMLGPDCSKKGGAGNTR